MNEIDTLSSLPDPNTVTKTLDGYSLYDETLINCEVHDGTREDDVGEVMVEIVGSELIINGISNEDGSWNWETEEGDEYKYSFEDIFEPTNMIGHDVEEGESKIDLKIEMNNSNKSNHDQMDSSSASEILSLLRLVAVEPKRGGYDFLSSMTTFFSGFRNSISVHFPRRQSTQSGKKRKACNAAKSSPEESEYDEVIDSYRDERTFENGSNERLPAGKSNIIDQDWRRIENGPTELVLNFCEGNAVPVESHLNKMFKRFGPLRELETEVDRERWRARVVFKRWSDAEVALSSAEAFNIFGSVMVNYQLNYAPSTSFQSLPFPLLEKGKTIQLC